MQMHRKKKKVYHEESQMSPKNEVSGKSEPSIGYGRQTLKVDCYFELSI